MTIGARSKRYGETSALLAKHADKSLGNTIIKKLSNAFEPQQDDDIDSLDFDTWITLNAHEGRKSKLNTNQITIALLARTNGFNTEASIANYIRIRIGNAIIEQLGWQEGDRIKISVNPKNLMQFALNKSTTGYKLGSENKSTTKEQVYTIGAKFDNPLKLKKFHSEVVKHGIHELDYLTFRIPVVNPSNDA